MKPEKLFKTTIVIWSDFDASDCDLADLAIDAVGGESYCSSQVTVEVTDPAKFPAIEFFDMPD